MAEIQKNLSELKNSINSLKKNLDKDTKELSKNFNNTSNALSKNFKNLNNLDLSVNTRDLQGSLNDLRGNLDNTSKVMKKNMRVINDSVNAASELTTAYKNLAGSFSNSKSASRAESNNDDKETIKSVKELAGKIFPEAKGWIDLVGNVFNFDSGGIVPGNFSKPVPVVAHGSEMILNPSQQANLFKMLNGQSGNKGEPNYVYAPQIKTGASANEVFEVLNRHSRQFFAMVSEGVQKDSGLRNAVRSAQ